MAIVNKKNQYSTEKTFILHLKRHTQKTDAKNTARNFTWKKQQRPVF